MPDLTLPYPVNDSPHNPEKEYKVEVDDISLSVHFEGHRAYVRLPNDDFLDATIYCAKFLPTAKWVEVLKRVRYLKREYDID